MRLLVVLIPVMIIVPFIALNLLQSVTGDSLSAVILGLTIFVSIAAWMAGPSAAAGHAAGS